MSVLMRLGLVYLLISITQGYSSLHLKQNDMCKRDEQREWLCKQPEDCSYVNVTIADSCDKPMICCPPERKARQTTENKANSFCELQLSFCHRNLDVGDSDSAMRITVDDNNKVPVLEKVVEQKEHPYMALLGYRGKKWACGGILISERFILTTAHCANLDGLGAPKSVRLGSESQEVENDVEDVLINPKYAQENFTNDLALVKMVQSVVFNSVIKPVCIYTMPRVSYEEVISVGWTSVNTETSGEQRISPKESTYFMKNINSCSGAEVSNEDQLVCASNGVKNFCEVYPGSMLVVRMGNRCLRSLIGVGTARCSSQERHLLYNRASSHLEWIQSVVWATDFNY